MKRIIVKYSGDFRRSKVVNGIYEIFRDKGFEPAVMKNNYVAATRDGEAEYIFGNETILPEKSKLEEMLKGMNFDSVEILNSEEGAE